MPGPYTQGPLTNPAANTILADSGARPAGGKFPAFVVSSSIAAVVVLEYRDAANAANIWAHTFPIAAMTPFPFQLPGNNYFDAAEGERFRVRLNAIIVGVIQVTLWD